MQGLGKSWKLQRRENCFSSKLLKVSAFETDTIRESFSNRARSSSVCVVAVKKAVNESYSFASQSRVERLSFGYLWFVLVSLRPCWSETLKTAL